MRRKLSVYRIYLTPLSLLLYVWCDTHNQLRSNSISKVRARRSNKEISKFNNIPMSTVKKHKKDYTDFIDTGNSPEDYDITSKSHKRCSNAQGYDIVARVQELVDTDPSKSMRAMTHELEVSTTLVCKIVNWRTSDINHMASEKVSLC